MKKMMKKTSAIAISAFMLAQYIPFTAIAVPGTGGSNIITIHSYQLGAADYATASATNNATGTTADQTTVNGYSTASPRGGMTYNIYGATYNATTQKYDVDTSAPITSVVTASSGENIGVGSSVGLNPGVYWIDPVDDTNTNPEFANADAFFIELPNTANPLHIYPKTTKNDQSTPTTDDGKLHTIEFTKTNSNNAAISGVEFKVYFKNAQDEWESAKDTTTGNDKIYTTGSNGKITITGLPVGDYYFVEQSLGTNAATYLLDQTPQKVTITGVKSGETATAVTKTFINENKLEVGKEISADGAGHVYNWTITADLPDNKDNLISYVITDKFKGIDITGVTIEGLDGTAATPDFTAAASLTNPDEYIITITDAGLAKIKDPANTTFNSATELKITVASTLDTTDLSTGNANEAANGNAVNKASISYKYAYNPDPDDPSTPDIPGITDPDDDPTYPSEEDSPAAPPADPDPSDITPTPDTPVDAVKPCKFYISNRAESEEGTELTSGRYEIPNGSYHDDETSGDNVNLAVVTDLAPGPYTIQQLGTESGYQVDTEIKNIYVGKDGNIYNYDPTAAEGSRIGSKITGNTVIFVNNQKTSNFNLPFTCTTATIIFTITGVLLMASTGFFIFILLKKRDDDEEEKQENN